ncbi:LRR receptor-like serine threonine-protein kinase At4g08850-like [Seminavis robusta]|uniref:LRR receptor-like serine threonine-protein kinase At4g08850-like n=1 Tax=Seminavis robusta TaxID=568900 RepID=A0A9N8HV86_9STRA|nr:LRR receptor-like serine threonine-protein kinase At4g08850-like [Seminavis robusta]|eukprot:Sro1475_g275830.1 LRR receptor-like serine threonine-protein kinase At4g08850-like (727) ;mRNA; r:9447-12106
MMYSTNVDTGRDNDFDGVGLGISDSDCSQNQPPLHHNFPASTRIDMGSSRNFNRVVATIPTPGAAMDAAANAEFHPSVTMEQRVSEDEDTACAAGNEEPADIELTRLCQPQQHQPTDDEATPLPRSSPSSLRSYEQWSSASIRTGSDKHDCSDSVTLSVSAQILFAELVPPPQPLPTLRPTRPASNPGAYPFYGGLTPITIAEGQHGSNDNTTNDMPSAYVATNDDDHHQQTDLGIPQTDSEPTSTSNPRPTNYWRRKLLLALSLETNVACFVVIMILLFLFMIFPNGPTATVQQQNEQAIRIPSTPGLARAAATQAPTTFLDGLNLPEGSHWVKQHGWLDWEMDECNWKQLVLGQEDSSELNCNDNGEIKALTFMNANNLVGTLPPEISLLDNSLEYLEIARQEELSRTIPTEIGLLTRLANLEFTVTGLSGTVPTEIGQLQSLQNLQFAMTQLLGSIPSEVGQLGNLSALRFLRTNLTGSMPAEVFQLQNLKIFTVDGCTEMNTEFLLPNVIENMHQLEFLFLSKQTCGEENPFPSGLGNLSNIRALFLYEWKLNGTIPSNIGGLTKLNQLVLHGNSISGTFPQELSKLSGLLMLNMGANKIEGKLPPDIFSKLTMLRQVYINDNKLSGRIPTDVGQLSGLKKLELQHTRLSGSLPTELLALANLTSLVITDTGLTGSIPVELCGKLQQLELRCFGGQYYEAVMTTNASVCQGTSLCGCNCAPC